MPTLEQLEKLLAADPEDAFLLYGLAHEHAKRGDHERATGFFDRCLAIDPAYCYAYYHKARSLQALGRDDSAVETLKSGLKRAQVVGDGHAASEIAALLDELS